MGVAHFEFLGLMLLQAYEIVKGALVRGCNITPNDSAPTFVLVHGILGSRRNMQKYAKILVEVS